MKKKLAMYVIVPVVGLSLLGPGIASAHGWFGIGKNASPEDLASGYQTMFQAKAQLLGISVDELKTKWAEGKTIKQIAEEKGISEDELQKKMKGMKLQEMKSRIQTLVDRGIITQVQADTRIKFMESNVEQGKHGMRLGRGGWF